MRERPVVSLISFVQTKNKSLGVAEEFIHTNVRSGFRPTTVQVPVTLSLKYEKQISHSLLRAGCKV